ncbi:MAG: hypothetical protein U9R27_12575 [Campylobacterota bacterium]|nr:hypothetical protein [Campylobacterota bacterium]
MVEILNRILENSKVAYRESIIMDNELAEDKLLSIISDSKYLIDMLENTQIKKTTKIRNAMHSDNRSEAEEVQRIYRRVPLWLNRPHQYNHKILVAYMMLSDNNETHISVSSLEKHSDIKDSSKFYSHYNQMKIISEKNHAKVFTEENGNVQLWKPVSEFIINEYNKKFN